MGDRPTGDPPGREPNWVLPQAADYRPLPMLLALSMAQTVFALALAAVTISVVAFAAYVISTVIWADRWVRRPKLKGPTT